MRRTTLAILGLGWSLWVVPMVHGQAPLPSPVSELNHLVHEMSEHVRHLGDDISADLGQAPQGQILIQDTQELAQAIGEFHETLHNSLDTYQVRQSYSGIDNTWHHLQAQLAQPGFNTPAVARAASRVGEADARIHQVLGLNTLPANYYGAGQAPTGMAETQRLAHALVERAEALAVTIRADMVGGGGRLLQDAVNLAQAADLFHDGIDLNARPDIARNGFAGVAALSDRLEQDLAAIPPPPRVQAAWQAFQAVEVLLRQDLGLPNAPQDLALSAIPVGSPSPVVALADQLVTQVNAFIQVFSQTAGAVPEGGFFLADAQRLQAAAADFRQDAARGLNTGQLAYEFRDVDALWQRLARRTNRIARGRSGPNIQQVASMGQTIAQIHQLLGMPGFAPMVISIPTP